MATQLRIEYSNEGKQIVTIVEVKATFTGEHNKWTAKTIRAGVFLNNRLKGK